MLIIYLTYMQGLVISLPYCYLNSEVQNVVQSNYKRWQLIRTVGRTGQEHSQTSGTAASFYNVSRGQVVACNMFTHPYNAFLHAGLCVREQHKQSHNSSKYLDVTNSGRIRQNSSTESTRMEMLFIESDSSKGSSINEIAHSDIKGKESEILL